MGAYGNQCQNWNCSGIDHNNPLVCSTRGQCLAPDVCLCNRWWYGRDCEFYIDNKTRSISTDWITIQPQGNGIFPSFYYFETAYGFDNLGNLYIYQTWYQVLYRIDAITFEITNPTINGNIPPQFYFVISCSDYHDNIYIQYFYDFIGDISGMYKLDLKTMTFTNYVPSVPDLLYDSSMISDFDGNLYIYGGESEITNDYTNNLWKWNRITEKWTLLSSFGETRSYHSMTIDILNNDIYIIGGAYYLSGLSGWNYLSDIIRYNINTNTSTLINNLPYGIESPSSTTYYDQNLYIFGGGDSINYPSQNSFWKYDIRNNVLTNIASNFTNKDRYKYPLFIFDGKNRIYMGFEQGGGDTNDLYYLILDYQCYGLYSNDTNVCSGFVLY